MKQLEHIHGGNLVRASLKYNLPVDQFLDFSANINPLGPSQAVYKALTSSLDLISNYPDPDCTELREMLSGFLGISRDLLLMGNGAAELIYLLVRVTGCRKALIPVPTFCEYSLSVLSQGGEVLEVSMEEEEGFPLPVEKVLHCLPKVDLVFLCNPNNPTGRLVDAKTLERIVREAQDYGVTVLLDEAFMDFVPQREEFSLLSRVGRMPNLLVLYSLTKFFAIPGLRLGAIAGPGHLIGKMSTSKDPWNVNIMAQVAGLAGLNNLEHMEETKRLVQEEKRFLFDELYRIPGIEPLPAAANFILVRVANSGMTSSEITDQMGKRGILVRDCQGFTGLAGRYFRTAVKSRPENQKMINTLKDVLGGNE